MPRVISTFGENATLRLNTQPGAYDVAATFKVTEKPEGYLDIQGGLAVMRAFALLQSTGLGAPPKGGAWGASDAQLLIFRPGVPGRLLTLFRNPQI